MRTPKRRTIFNNYNVTERYEAARLDILEENPDAEPADREIWERVTDMETLDWDDEHARLREFFAGERWLAMGSVGRWTGSHAAGTVFNDWDDFFHDATRDCDYWEIWDENGHFYVRCSHHDGTNNFEIKRLSRRGVEVLENWEWDYTNETPEEIMHDTLFNCNLFSGLPHFAHTVYGCPKMEVEKA